MMTFKCGRCPTKAEQTRQGEFVLDPPGWAVVVVNQDRVRTQRLCPACHALLRAFLDRKPVPAENALCNLVLLHDGPRDETYETLKDLAWQTARDVLA